MNFIAIFKVNKWWNYKVGGALFTYLLTKAVCNDPSIKAAEIVLFVVFLLLILLGFGVNDYSDYAQDRAVGKRNIFDIIPLKYALLYFAPLLLLTIGLCVSFLRFEIIILLILNVLLNCAYSLHPFRLKEHKYLSIITTGFYERTLPYLIIIIQVLVSKRISILQYIFVGLYLVWSFLWETRNYINGQLNDYENDERSGVKSLVSAISLSGVQSFKAKLFFAEITFLLLWLFVAISSNQKLFVLPFLAIFLPFFHRVIQGKSVVFVASKESFLDYLYNYVFIAVIIIYEMIFNSHQWLFTGVFLLLLFKSKHLENTYAKLFVVCRRIVSSVYDFLFFIASSIVNYSIYYFRKYVLHWSENRSRGIKHRIIFLHIPKTAGTTFHKILDKQFLPENVFTIQVVNNAYLNTNNFIAMSQTEKTKIYLLKGHQAFGLHHHMEGETKYMTFLREPRERIVSFYYYTKQNLNLELGKLIQENDWSLYDFVANVKLKELNNAYLKLISGMDGTEEVMMAAALENIKNHFSFIGLTEYFEDSLKRLEMMYGWKIESYVNYKVNESRPNLSDIDERTMKLIEEKNHGDILLYEKIKTKFLYAAQP